MERVKGIEPSSQAWEAHVLPLNHTRKTLRSIGNMRVHARQGKAFADNPLHASLNVFR